LTTIRAIVPPKNREVSPDRIEKSILLIRGQKVMLDSDLAELYGVPIKRLNEQVRRNRRRFPADFMFQLTQDEYSALRSQNVTLKQGRGKHRKYLPYAFSEQGVAMLSSVLTSKRAIEVNIEIMRAFVRLRQFISAHKELSQKLAELERKVGTHDEQIQVIFDAIRQLMVPLEPKKRKIGFLVKEKAASYGRR
jgi:ORF6N domain